MVQSRALRYPKPAWFHSHLMADASGTETAGGTINYKLSRSSLGCVLAPARYSQVRKVRFYVSVRNASATALVNPRLRVWVASVTGTTSTPDVKTLTAGAAGASYWNTSSIVARIFSKIGTAGANVASSSSGSTSLYEIEFDRFDGLSNDFFTCWDSVSGLDDYIDFRPALAVNSGPAAGNMTFCSIGAVVVQAPAAPNNSVTYVQISRPAQLEATGPTTFESAVSPAASQVRGAWRWRYNASDWDGIVAVHLMVRAQKRTTAGVGFDVRLERVTGNTQGSGSTTTIASATVAFATLNELGTWRSANVLSSLIDGGEYTFDYRNGFVAGSSVGAGDGVAFLEIIQQTHTKTVSYHLVTPPATTASNGLTSAVSTQPLIQSGASLFDPLWYANFPNSRILKRLLIGQLNHRIAGLLDPTLELCWNSNLSEDQNGSPGTGLTATSRVVTPMVTATPINTAAWKYAEGTIQGNDPIEQAGSRKLFMRLEGTWTHPTTPDSPGALRIAYALDVPNTETLPLGDVFELGEFNPEGCASTAAGLGDPGILAITNGSVPPKKFNPAASNVEDLGIPEPFPNEIPSYAVASIAASPLTGLGAGLYVYRYTFRNTCTKKESNPNPDDIIVDTGGATPAAKVTLSFANVRIPGDPQITEICLYRTVIGGAFPVLAKVGCFDISLTTVFIDTLSDLALDFTNEPLSQLNAPPPCCFSIVEFKNRLWLAGDIPDLSPAGTVSAVTGSDIITGSDNVEWDRCLEGKTIQLAGDCRGYEILRILPPPAGTSPAINRLQLTEAYEQASTTGSLYVICGKPNRLYFSEPFEPEYWPEINFIDVEPGDGDRITGLASNFDRLVVYKRSKTYVVTFDENPVTEGTEAHRISSDMGAIAFRSFAQVENGTVGLAERGLILFDGRGVQHVPESVEMNEIFIDPDNANYVRRDINGRVVGAVGVYYAKREQYLLLLPSIRTTRGADMMLVWNVKLRNITLLSFCQEFASMVVGKDSEGNDRVYLGDTNGFVWIYDLGQTDGVGVPNSTGTVRGFATASGVDPATTANFIDDSAASFIEGGLPSLAGLSGVAGLSGAFSGAPGDNLGLAGVCVFFRQPDSAPDDAWESRVVYAATATRLYVTPSLDGDITGYEYMIGPIELDLRFKPNNYGTDDNAKRNWRHAVTFVPQEQASKLRIEVLNDLAATDELATETEEPTVGLGRTFDMSQSKGRLVAPLPRKIHNFIAVRMHNFAPDEPLEILNHAIMFEPEQGR